MEGAFPGTLPGAGGSGVLRQWRAQGRGGRAGVASAALSGEPGAVSREGGRVWSWRQLHSPSPVAQEVQDIGLRRERRRQALGGGGGLETSASSPRAPQRGGEGLGAGEREAAPSRRRRWWPRRLSPGGAAEIGPGGTTRSSEDDSGRQEGIVGVLHRARAADAAAACLLQLMSTLQRLRFVVEQLESVSEGSVRDHAMRVLEHVQRMAAVEWHALEQQVQALGSEGGAEAASEVEGLGPFVLFIEGTLRHLQGLATEMLEGEEKKGLSDVEFKRLLTTTVVGLADQAYLHGVEPPGQCSVCLLDFQPTDTLTQLPCNWRHVFHRHCIRGWLARQSTCPLCRSTCRLPPPRKPLEASPAPRSPGADGGGRAESSEAGGAESARAGPTTPTSPRLLWVAQAESARGRSVQHVSVLQLRRLHSRQLDRGRATPATSARTERVSE